MKVGAKARILADHCVVCGFFWGDLEPMHYGWCAMAPDAPPSADPIERAGRAVTRPTVAATLLADLARARGWVCGSTFYASYRPTFAQRFSELNAETPGLIVSRVCHRDGHEHRSTVHEYALREFASAEQTTLKMTA